MQKLLSLALASLSLVPLATATTAEVPAPVVKSCVKSNQIALTFEDGPWVELTGIVNALVKKGAKATFLVNGNNYSNITETHRVIDVKYAIDKGMELANQGFSHSPSTDRHVVRQEIEKLHHVLKETFNYRTSYFRHPFSDDSESVRYGVADAGYTHYIGYLVDTSEGNTIKDADFAAKNLKDWLKAKPGHSPIVLAMETADYAIHFTNKVLNAEWTKGYKFVTLKECITGKP